jgi:hypothetical protein
MTVLTTFLPWARSGAATRNSYVLIADVDELGVLTGAAGHGAALWPFVPFVAGAAVCALAFGRRRAGAALGALVGLAVAFAAVAVLRSPLEPLSGCWAALAAGTGNVVLAAFVGAFPHRLDDCESISTVSRSAQDVTP